MEFCAINPVPKDEDIAPRTWSIQSRLPSEIGKERGKSETYWTEEYGPGWSLGLYRRYGCYGEKDVVHNISLRYEKETLGIKRTNLRTFISLLSLDGKEGVLEDERIFSWKSSDCLSSISGNRLEKYPIIAITIFYVGPAVAPAPSNVPFKLGSLVSSISKTLDAPNFCDTVFYAYSSRLIEGGGHLPLPVYANAKLLQEKSEYFRDMFDPKAPFKKDDPIEPHSEEYLYEEDSDLEDETEAKFDGEVDIVNCPNECQLTEDLTSSASPAGNVIERRLAVRDAAYKTWAALVFYLYTGNITFAPLLSSKSMTRSEFDLEHKCKHPDSPFPCSPKSMFRLADKLGIEELENLAFEAIKDNISRENVVEEYFSEFSLTFDRVRDFEKKFIDNIRWDGTVRQAFHQTKSRNLP